MSFTFLRVFSSVWFKSIYTFCFFFLFLIPFANEVYWEPNPQFWASFFQQLFFMKYQCEISTQLLSHLNISIIQFIHFELKSQFVSINRIFFSCRRLHLLRVLSLVLLEMLYFIFFQHVQFSSKWTNKTLRSLSDFMQISIKMRFNTNWYLKKLTSDSFLQTSMNFAL